MGIILAEVIRDTRGIFKGHEWSESIQKDGHIRRMPL